MDDPLRLLVAVVCTWRVTHLLQAEDGPWDASLRLRRAVGNGVMGQILDCFYCLSLWVALPLTWLLHPASLEDALLLWPALSGAALLLQRACEREEADPGAAHGAPPTPSLPLPTSATPTEKG